MGAIRPGGGGPITAAAIAAVLVAAFALLSGGERAATLGLTRHGQLVTVQDAGAADAVAAVAVSPGTAGQVLTVSDAGLPHWAAASGGSSTQAASLAEQARGEALRRRGPVAMRTVGVSGVYTASTAPSTMPMISRGGSGVLTVYSPQAGGYSSMILFQSGAWGSNGWYISGGGGVASNIRVAAMAASNEPLDFPTAISTVGWHTIAWALSADGTTARYSIDGSDAATLTPGVVPMTPTPRDPNAAVYIGSNGSSTGVSPLALAYLALWSSILSDSALKSAASSPSAGAPVLPSTPAWEWAAAAFVGVSTVRIGTATYSVIGTTEWWMP